MVESFKLQEVVRLGLHQMTTEDTLSRQLRHKHETITAPSAHSFNVVDLLHFDVRLCLPKPESFRNLLECFQS